MAIVRWSPFRSIMSLRDEMDRLLNEFYGSMLPSSESYEGDWYPAMDVSETDSEVIATLELPGMKREDIKVTVSDGVLTVSGEKKQEKVEENENRHRVERTYGYFKRSVSLPAEIDTSKVKAVYKDGVLKVTMPKLEEKKTKEIPVQVS